jgi:aspartate beta-hydroxylase
LFEREPQDDDDDESETIVEETPPEVKKDDSKNDEKFASDIHDNDKDEDDDDDDDEEDDSQPAAPQLHLPKHNPIKIPKKKAASWRRNIVAEDNPAPRKNLLKHSKRKQKAYPQGDENNNEDENDDDDENEEGEDETMETDAAEQLRMQTHDIVSIRKKSPQYNRKAITNRDDYKHRNRLDTADFLLEKHEFAKASSLYEQVLSYNKESPRGHFGKARTLQLRSEFEGNEYLLDAAIAEYQIVLDDEDTPEALFRMTADNIIECARYRGNLHKVMTVQRALLDRFPDDIELQNNFGVTFLMMGRIEDARNVFSAVLEANPNDALAQAYYGYILKVHDHDFERGVQYMRRGLRGSDEAIIDAKFYFHLGDGLMRLGRNQEALRVYEEATHLGLFPSPLQRSFHNLEGLIARPWWTLEQTGCGKHLKHVERQWTVIREEAIKLWQNYEESFEAEDLHLTEGRLVAYPITRDSTFIEENCKRVPQTCTILKKFVNDAGCFKGDIRISTLQTGTRIWPHCGATNYVLEAQLGLQVTSDARIRVAADTKGWKTGKFLVYDESFEHEIWFDGASANTVRIILSMELWHPEVPQLSRADTLRP